MWLHMEESDLDRLDIKDQNLRLTLAFGIGMHHAGLVERDRKTVEELFVNQKIQVSHEREGPYQPPPPHHNKRQRMQVVSF